MTEQLDLNSPVGRALARSLGFVVPPEADGSAPTVALPEDSGESEKEFQARVVKLAKERGWKCFHPFDMRKSEPGWPDISAVRGKRLLFAELKVGRRKATKEQLEWMAALEQTAAEVYLWTPGCIEEIRRILE